MGGELPLTVGNYTRPSLGLPSTRLVNAFVEATPGGPTQAARIPRAGLTPYYTVGAGPIYALVSIAGDFGGDMFAVSGTTLYRQTAGIGSVASDPVPRIAASSSQVAVVSGGGLYVYDGSTFQEVTLFDDGESPLPTFSGVTYLGGQFIYPQLGTNQFYWSQIGNAKSINGLSFANAETSPDPIVDVQTLGDELVFFGTQSVEWWDQTGDPNLPFQLSPGRTYIRGTAAKGSIVKMDNSLFFLGDDRVVYRTSAVPQRVSVSGVEDALRRCTQIAACTAYVAFQVGHQFYVINIPGQGTWAFDVQTAEWCEWASYERATFIGQCATLVGQSGGDTPNATYIGSAVDGRVWMFDPDAALDDDEPKPVTVCGFLPLAHKNLSCNNVALACVRGVGTLQIPDPKVRMRYSDDGGRTFSEPLYRSLGGVGEYGVKAIYRRLGFMGQPGRLFEFTVTDGVPFVVEGATFNLARP